MNRSHIERKSRQRKQVSSCDKAKWVNVFLRAAKQIARQLMRLDGDRERHGTRAINAHVRSCAQVKVKEKETRESESMKINIDFVTVQLRHGECEER